MSAVVSAVAELALPAGDSGHDSYNVIRDSPDFLLENLRGSD
jgi:hypothetical protein